MGKTSTKTTTQNLDPRSQGYVNNQRAFGQEAADYARDNASSFFLGAPNQTPGQMAQPFMNPYRDQVIGGIRGEFDHMRGQATLGANEAATRAGAFGGSRHGVREGVQLGELDRAQGSTVGNFLHQGYQDSMNRGTQFAEYKRALAERQAQAGLFGRQQGMGFLNAGMGPTGLVQEQSETGSTLGTIAGLGMTAASLFGGPVGAAAAGAGRAMIPSAGSTFQAPPFIPQGGMSGGPGANPLSPWGNPNTQLPGPHSFFRPGG